MKKAGDWYRSPVFVLELNNKYLPKLKSMAKIDRNG